MKLLGSGEPIIILCILMITATTTTYDDISHVNNGSKIFENHGILLKSKGLVTFSSENMISIFRKVQAPLISNIQYCRNNWVPKFNRQISQATDDYIQLFNHITEPAIPRRDKRSILAFGIGLGLADLVLGGIGYGSLKSHMNSLQNKFNDFAQKQHKFNSGIIAFEKDLITMIEKSNSEITYKFNQIECKIIDATGELLANQYLTQWIQTVDSLLKPITEGNIKMHLTPKILNTQNLR